MERAEFRNTIKKLLDTSFTTEAQIDHIIGEVTSILKECGIEKNIDIREELTQISYRNDYLQKSTAIKSESARAQKEHIINELLDYLELIAFGKKETPEEPALVAEEEAPLITTEDSNTFEDNATSEQVSVEPDLHFSNFETPEEHFLPDDLDSTILSPLDSEEEPDEEKFLPDDSDSTILSPLDSEEEPVATSDQTEESSPEEKSFPFVEEDDDEIPLDTPDDDKELADKVRAAKTEFERLVNIQRQIEDNNMRIIELKKENERLKKESIRFP